MMVIEKSYDGGDDEAGSNEEMEKLMVYLW